MALLFSFSVFSLFVLDFVGAGESYIGFMKEILSLNCGDSSFVMIYAKYFWREQQHQHLENLNHKESDFWRSLVLLQCCHVLIMFQIYFSQVT